MILGEVAQNQKKWFGCLLVPYLHEGYVPNPDQICAISLEEKTMSCSTITCIANVRVNSYEAPEVLEKQFISFLPEGVVKVKIFKYVLNLF